ncbi:MAG: hypothetical protein ABI954_10410 [Pyrinomonadaceae bacterium]
MQAIIENEQVWEKEKIQKHEETVGFFVGIFGCWHKELSRPFTTANNSYRVCLNCGARRHFDTETLKTYGQYYFPLEAKVVEFKQN